MRLQLGFQHPVDPPTVWDACWIREFFNYLIGFTEIPPLQAIEKLHTFQSGGIPACQLSSSQNGWIIPTALMSLHPSPEYWAKLRSNYSRLQAALQNVQSAEGRLVGALLGTAVGDLLTARRDMGEFIKHAQRTVIPATIVESLVRHDQGYDQRNSRAERVARLLKRSAAHARACSQVIRTTIKFGVSRGHYPLAWMQLRKILNQHRLVKGIIIYPALVVYSLLRQRPHQLGRALAEQGYLFFFFCTGNPQRDQVNGFRQLGQNFYLCSVPFEVFRTIDDPILYISSLAGWRQRVREVTGRDTARIFYDWMDDLAVFGRVENQIDEHAELLHSAEIVAASASLLFAEARKIRPDVLLLPNGVRLEDFQDIADGPALAPAMLQDTVNQKQPIIGYYGSISSWFDFDLFQHVLEMNPEKLFIMNS